jgi:hypothetical protein
VWTSKVGATRPQEVHVARILILARNMREAGSYAKTMGIPQGQFRAVQKAGAIRGVRNAEVHILPSFLVRRDRHAILGALKNARHLTTYYVDPADLEPSEPTNGSVTSSDGSKSGEAITVGKVTIGVDNFFEQG